jgi:hypothetical protein
MPTLINTHDHFPRQHTLTLLTPNQPLGSNRNFKIQILSHLLTDPPRFFDVDRFSTCLRAYILSGGGAHSPEQGIRTPLKLVPGGVSTENNGL